MVRRAGRYRLDWQHDRGGWRIPTAEDHRRGALENLAAGHGIRDGRRTDLAGMIAADVAGDREAG